jgi:DNA-directed RNA polymerase specialized sigma24 family protein
VLREYWKEAERNVASIEDLPASAEIAEDPFYQGARDEERIEKEQRLECMSDCIHRLPPESLSLINEYHHGEKREKIDRRKRLAERLNIPLNALRIRAFRIRADLENCITRCMAGKNRK